MRSTRQPCTRDSHTFRFDWCVCRTYDYMCPHTTIYVPSYIYVFSYYCMRTHTLQDRHTLRFNYVCVSEREREKEEER